MQSHSKIAPIMEALAQELQVLHLLLYSEHSDLLSLQVAKISCMLVATAPCSCEI